MLKKSEIIGDFKVGRDITPKKQDAKYINSEVEKLNNEKLSTIVRNYEV